MTKKSMTDILKTDDLVPVWSKLINSTYMKSISFEHHVFFPKYWKTKTFM